MIGSVHCQGANSSIYNLLPQQFRLLRRELTGADSMCPMQGVNPWIEVDGGVSPANAYQLIEVGANALVAGSAVFGAKDYAEGELPWPLLPPSPLMQTPDARMAKDSCGWAAASFTCPALHGMLPIASDPAGALPALSCALCCPGSMYAAGGFRHTISNDPCRPAERSCLTGVSVSAAIHGIKTSKAPSNGKVPATATSSSIKSNAP